jgi:hypothetical protein
VITLKETAYIATLPAISYSPKHQCRIWPLPYQIRDLAPKICAAVLIYGDVVNVLQAHASMTKAIFDRLRWKSRPVLHTAKTFLFDGRD